MCCSVRLLQGNPQTSARPVFRFFPHRRRDTLSSSSRPSPAVPVFLRRLCFLQTPARPQPADRAGERPPDMESESAPDPVFPPLPASPNNSAAHAPDPSVPSAHSALPYPRACEQQEYRYLPLKYLLCKIQPLSSPVLTSYFRYTDFSAVML